MVVAYLARADDRNPHARDRCISCHRNLLRADESVRLNLHQHRGVYQPAHLDHRCRGPDLAENFSVRPAHLFPILDVGDIHARAHDIRAARMNGTRSAGVLWGYGSREELAAADAIVTVPAELPQVLTAMAAATPRR